MVSLQRKPRYADPEPLEQAPPIHLLHSIPEIRPSVISGSKSKDAYDAALNLYIPPKLSGNVQEEEKPGDHVAGAIYVRGS